MLRDDPHGELTMAVADASLLIWPTPLPESLLDLPVLLADLLGHGEGVGIEDLDAAPISRHGSRRALVLVIDPAGQGNAAPQHAAAWLARADSSSAIDLVVIAGDGFLGADLPDRAPAIWGAAVVAAVRSIAVSRGGSIRANVVAVPDSLFGLHGKMRGPLRQPVETEDVANAAAFMLSTDNDYVSGQVLYVDQGRHLFSSATA